MRVWLAAVGLLCFCCATLGAASALSHDDRPLLTKWVAFGTPVGSYESVTARSNGGTHAINYVAGAVYGTYGWTYQCVEYVNRFYVLALGHRNMRGSGNANTYYDNASSLGLSRYANGGTTKPAAGDILCSNGGSYGHIAIVRSVGSSSVHVIQQNWYNDSHDGDMVLSMSVSGGRYTVSRFSASYPVQGWLRIPGGGSPPNPPACSKPAHESHFLGRPIFDWDPVPGATHYQLYIPGLYTSPWVIGTSYRLPVNPGREPYWWKVRAKNSAGTGPWTEYPYRVWLAPYTEPFKGDDTQPYPHDRWGWTHVNDLQTTHSPDGESWGFEVIASDSQILSPPAYFGRAYHQVDIEIANHTESQLCQIFWQRPGMSYFDQAHHVNARTTVQRSVAHATCYFHPDTMRLRFDPVAGCPGSDPETGGDPYVEWYRIGFRVNVTWPDWEFDVDNNGKGWWWDDSSKFHHIDNSLFPNNGVWRLRITGDDPFMVSPPTNLEGSDWIGAEITMRNDSNSGEAQFCWKTSEMSGFDAAHSVNFDASNDNIARTYFIPLAMSGTITGLRFDPCRGSSGSVYLEGIRLVPTSGVTLNPIGNKLVNEGLPLEFTVTASSASGALLTLSASNLPPGASFVQDPENTGVFSWVPDYDQSGIYSGVHFQVTDGTATASEDIVITVNDVNRLPVMDEVGDHSAILGEELRFTVCASDPDGDPLTFISQELPSFSTFTQIGPTCAEYVFNPYAVGTINGGWIGVSDGRGGVVGSLFQIHVGEGLHTLAIESEPAGVGSARVNGTVRSLPWSEDIAAGAMVELEAVPGTGASFSHWSGSLTGSANPTTITMDGPKSVTAHFVVDGRTLSVPDITASLEAPIIQVPVSVDDATGIAGIDFTVNFDTAVVHCDGAAIAELTSGFFLAKNIDNESPIGYCIVSMGSSEAIASGSGPVAFLSFMPAPSVESGDSSVLDLDDCHLYDEGAVDIPVGAEDGSIAFGVCGDPCDVNRDGIVNSGDAILLLRAAVGLPAPEGWQWDWPPLQCNDVNSDGAINSADAIIVLRVAVGLQDSPSCSDFASAALDPGLDQATVDRSLSLPAVTVGPDEATIVQLAVDDATDIAGADFQIVFDPMVVHVVGTYTTGMTEGWFVISNADNVAGTVSISLASAEGLPFGSGSLVDIELEGVGESCEETPLQFVNHLLYDEGAAAIGSTATDGSVRLDFADATGAHWAHDEITSCVDAGIVAGYDDGLYHGDWPVDRAQMAVFIARAMAGGDASVPEFTDTPTFTDVPEGYWALKHVEYAVDQSVVAGYGDSTYRPEEPVDRGQMAVFVARAKDWVGINDDMNTAPELFPDVPAGFWAGTAVQACVEQDVVHGYDDGYYRPDVTVTRDQMAVYIARAFDLTL